MFACKIEITLANRVEKLFGLAFDAVEIVARGAHAVAGGGSVEIEDEGDIWKRGSHGEGIDAGRLLRIDPPCDALVNGRGVHEAVTDHDAASLKGRGNRFPDELGAARRKEEEFGFRGESFAFGGVLKKMADRLASRRASRLADEERFGARAAEARSEALDLGRFPAAFRPLECDKKTVMRHDALFFDFLPKSD